MNRSASSAFWMLVERVTIVTSSAVTQIALARQLGNTAFGELSALLAASALLMPLAQGGLASLAVKAAVDSPDEEHAIFETATWWRLIASTLASVIGIAVWFGVSRSNDSNVFVLLAICQISLAFQVLEFRFQAQSKMATLTMTRVAVNLGFATLKIWSALNGAGVAYIAALFAVEFAALGCAHAIVSRMNFGRWTLPKIHLRWKRWFLTHSPWLIASAFAESINQRIDVIMLERLRGAAEAGTYAAASKISEAWFSVPYLLAAAVFPAILRTRERGSIPSTTWQLMLDRMVILTLTTSIVLSVFSAQIIARLYGDAYAASGSVLAIHVWAGLFVGMRAVLSRWIVTENLVRLSVFTATSGAAVNVGLNLVLIPNFGATGAAWATVGSYATAAWLSLVFSRHSRPMAHAMGRALILPLRPNALRRAISAGPTS